MVRAAARRTVVWGGFEDGFDGVHVGREGREGGDELRAVGGGQKDRMVEARAVGGERHQPDGEDAVTGVDRRRRLRDEAEEIGVVDDSQKFAQSLERSRNVLPRPIAVVPDECRDRIVPEVAHCVGVE
jgi:hypothetical protein